MKVLICFFVAALIAGQTWAAPAQPIAGPTPEMAALLARCAHQVHPVTMAAIVSAESRGHQFAIADAGPVHLPWAQRRYMVHSYYMGSVQDAAAKARALIADGHTVSLGLSQVNDRNLPALGLTLEEAFDSCTNLSAGARILMNFYQQAAKQFGEGPRALRSSISAYNSGSWLRGEKDGYVNLVANQVGHPLTLRTTALVTPVSKLKVPSLARTGVGKGSKQDRKVIFAMSAVAFDSTN